MARSSKLTGLTAAAMVAVVALAGCGGSSSGGPGESSATSSAGEGKTVALFLPETKTARYESKDRPAFTAKLAALCPDCTLLYYNADQDAAKQQQQVEAAITEGAEVLVLDPVDAKSAAALATRAKQSNIPVVSYSRLITGAPVDYFVSNDNEKVGEMQGQALVDDLTRRGVADPRIVMINGSPQDSAAADFKRGAHTVLDASRVQIVKEFDTPDWSPDQAQTEMEQAITALGADGFDAVYAANDGTAGGAIAALKGAGIDPATKSVTGQDAELAGVQRILAGDQYMTVYKKIGPQAEAAAELVAAIVAGKQPPAGLINATTDNQAGQVPSVFTPMVVVTRAEVQKEIVADGWWPVEQLCVGPYTQACTEAGVR